MSAQAFGWGVSRSLYRGMHGGLDGRCSIRGFGHTLRQLVVSATDFDIDRTSC